MKMLRSRLTYANVMSTIAVFMALGGGAYAVSGTADDPPRADSAQIPTRAGTIIGCYNRRTGNLRVVRSSRRCRRGRERVLRWTQRTDTSGFYTKTETDQRFLPLGGTAANALNAAQLEGLGAGAFESNTAVVAGKASQTSGSRLTVLEVPNLGFRMLTDGDADQSGQMRVQSTRSSGTVSLSSGAVLDPGQTSPEVEPDAFGGGGTTDIWRQVVTDDQTGKFAAVQCWISDDDVAQCVATTG